MKKSSFPYHQDIIRQTVTPNRLQCKFLIESAVYLRGRKQPVPGAVPLDKHRVAQETKTTPERETPL